jgi:hypothetical protein
MVGRPPSRHALGSPYSVCTTTTKGAERGGARFENPPAPETIERDQLSLIQSQPFTDEPEAGETPIEHDSPATL